MKKGKSGRGEYRSIRTVIVDGQDFRRLTPNAKLVWFFLKLQLGASGIDVFNAAKHVLAEQTGLDAERVADALVELQNPDNQWIRREANVVEIVDGLKHEPGLTLSNANHRTSLAEHLDGLPNLAIVKDFGTRYLGDDVHHTDGIPDAMPHTINNGMPEGVPEGVGHQERGKTKEERGKRKEEKKSPPPARETPTLSGRFDVGHDGLTVAVVSSRGVTGSAVDLKSWPKLRDAIVEAMGNGRPDAGHEFADGVAGVLSRFRRTDAETLAAIIANCNGALQGMHGQPRTLPEILTNLQDYALAEIVGAPSGAHFRAFIYRNPKVEPAPARSLPSGNGSAPRVSTLAAAELAKRLREARVQVTEGVRAGHVMLPPNWRTKFTSAEVRVIEGIGVERVMSEDEKQQGIILSQVANALAEVGITSTTTPPTTTTKPNTDK